MSVLPHLVAYCMFQVFLPYISALSLFQIAFPLQFVSSMYHAVKKGYELMRKYPYM